MNPTGAGQVQVRKRQTTVMAGRYAIRPPECPREPFQTFIPGVKGRLCHPLIGGEEGVRRPLQTKPAAQLAWRLAKVSPEHPLKVEAAQVDTISPIRFGLRFIPPVTDQPEERFGPFIWQPIEVHIAILTVPAPSCLTAIALFPFTFSP